MFDIERVVHGGYALDRTGIRIDPPARPAATASAHLEDQFATKMA